MSAQQAAAPVAAAPPAAGAAPAPAPAAPAAPPAEPYILLGGDGSPVVKIKQSDAKRIQDDAGEAPEDLEDSDLAESMQELGIQSLPLTNEDRKAMGMAPVGGTGAPTPTAAPAPPPPPPPPAMAAPVAAASGASVEVELKQYADLRDKGLISPDDYEAKKRQILGL